LLIFNTKKGRLVKWVKINNSCELITSKIPKNRA
jgi:hypothetical protein